jgi:hypothetical protein
MPRFPTGYLTVPHFREPPRGMIDDPAAHPTQARETTGGTVPVSVTSPSPETLGLSSHPAGWAADGAQPHAYPRQHRTSAAPGSHAHDGSVSVGGNLPGAQAGTSLRDPTAQSRWEAMDVDELLQEIMVDDLLHFGLRGPDDVWTHTEAATTASSPQVQPGTSTAAVPQAASQEASQRKLPNSEDVGTHAEAATAASSPHVQPGTSTAAVPQAASQEASQRKLLDIVPTKKNPVLVGEQGFYLKRRTPVLAFSGKRLPFEAEKANATPRLAENRIFVAQQVEMILQEGRYHVYKRFDGLSPMLMVSDLDSDRTFRVFVGLATQDASAVPKGSYTAGSDVLAKVTIDPRDGRTLKSLYLIPLGS